jgi:hypothetical protein
MSTSKAQSLMSSKKGSMDISRTYDASMGGTGDNLGGK